MYADYAFYMGIYHGEKVACEDWLQAERNAAAFLDSLTCGRIHQPASEPVRFAVCAVAEVEQRYAGALSRVPGLKNAGNDGYSESYEDSAALRSAYDADRLAAADLYLPRSSPLRYAGV